MLADPQVYPGYLNKVVDALNKREDIAFSLILGDLTDRSLRREFEWVAEAIKRANKPVLTVVGNHDGLLHGEQIYKQMFGDLNYSFQFHGVKFIMWNNNPYEWGYPDFDWLKNEVESSSIAIVNSHQAPGRIERYEGANERFRSLLAHEKVAGSLHGHTHKFYLQTQENKPIFTVARVSNVQYAIARFDEKRNLHIEQCEGSQCVTVEVEPL